ncbi:YebG family protein [Entomohabitans teleogrylli]|uniref:YebG family protein n=1 Tax=Entomohabitans teleogrylli TaxID=1384589 RepID=UPI00073D5B43|nr:YebG family protein [Entomohabitans teleogrylli]
MAVEIKYVVVREGEEKMSFATKKDADAYDKMLDLAEALGGWLRQSPAELAEQQQDALAMWLAENKESLMTLLKTGQLPAVNVQDPDAALPEAQPDAPAPVRGRKKVA